MYASCTMLTGSRSLSAHNSAIEAESPIRWDREYCIGRALGPLSTITHSRPGMALPEMIR